MPGKTTQNHIERRLEGAGPATRFLSSYPVLLGCDWLPVNLTFVYVQLMATSVTAMWVHTGALEETQTGKLYTAPPYLNQSA